MKTIITEKRDLILRMTDGYGIVHDYQCKNECPLVLLVRIIAIFSIRI
jgi:hypothetical protein